MDIPSSFPKIVHIGTRYSEGILDGTVEITEKVDGSQVGFGKLPDGSLAMRTKGSVLYRENTNKMFQEAVDMMLEVEDMLPLGIFFYGEYLQKPKHNVLQYEQIPAQHIALFGAMNLHTQKMADYRNYRQLGFDEVPTLFKGKLSQENLPALLDSLLEKDSFLGGTHIEGVVLKNYKDCTVGGQIYPVQAAKYVSEKFKEVHKKEWSKENNGWNAVKEMYRSEARWAKAVQHLREAEELEHDPRDIGKLIKEVQRDILSEEKERIMAILWREFGSDLLRRSTAGLPEWYKHYIVEHPSTPYDEALEARRGNEQQQSVDH